MFVCACIRVCLPACVCVCACVCPPEGEPLERSSHPTAMMLTSTVNLLKTLSLSAGIHADVMQADAMRTLCGLLRMLVASGASDKSGERRSCDLHGQ